MSRVRFTAEKAVPFTSRDGRVVRVVSVTLEVEPEERGEGGTIGGKGLNPQDGGEQFKRNEETDVAGGSGGTATNDVAQLWSYYVRLFEKTTALKLDDTRRNVIRHALKVRDLQTCKWAVYGLRHSPWHRGDNPERKVYDEIRYALRGKAREGESNEDRIDKMATVGREHHAVSQGRPATSSVEDDRVKRRVEELRQFAQSGCRREPTRSAQAKADLEHWGYVVELLATAPWVRVTRAS